MNQTPEVKNGSEPGIIEIILRIIFIAAAVGGVGSMVIKMVAESLGNYALADLSIEFFKAMLLPFFLSGIILGSKEMLETFDRLTGGK